MLLVQKRSWRSNRGLDQLEGDVDDSAVLKGRSDSFLDSERKERKISAVKMERVDALGVH